MYPPLPLGLLLHHHRLPPTSGFLLRHRLPLSGSSLPPHPLLLPPPNGILRPLRPLLRPHPPPLGWPLPPVPPPTGLRALPTAPLRLVAPSLLPPTLPPLRPSTLPTPLPSLVTFPTAAFLLPFPPMLVSAAGHHRFLSKLPATSR